MIVHFHNTKKDYFTIESKLKDFLNKKKESDFTTIESIRCRENNGFSVEEVLKASKECNDLSTYFSKYGYNIEAMPYSIYKYLDFSDELFRDSGEILCEVNFSTDNNNWLPVESELQLYSDTEVDRNMLAIRDNVVLVEAYDTFSDLQFTDCFVFSKLLTQIKV